MGIGIEFTPRICQVNPIWFLKEERKLYLCMDAFGIGTRDALIPERPKSRLISGKKNLGKTRKEIGFTIKNYQKRDGNIS